MFAHVLLLMSILVVSRSQAQPVCEAVVGSKNEHDELTFRSAIEKFRSIYKRFEKIESRPWGAEGALIEMVKQVGELAKHVMVAERYYFDGRETTCGYETNKATIGDELADIFSMLIRLADHYDIDLVEAHVRAREAEDASLESRGIQHRERS